MATHAHSDPYSEHHPDLSDAALARLTHELAHWAQDYDRNPRFPREAFDILAREGLIGLTVAKRLGGAGAGLVDALRVLGAVAKGSLRPR
jgi:alkylation response protein AidB-like acyl-CoA dehydrogenase